MTDRISCSGETCDRCHVAAAAFLYLTADLELALCAHHDRQHRPALAAAGFDRYELAVRGVRALVRGAGAGAGLRGRA